jgi:hypothetical protein
LEYAIHDDFKVLEKIGEGIFNEVCTLLFGEGFVDKTNELMNPNNDENIRKMMEGMIPPEMLRGCRDRDLSRDKAFMEWMNKMKKQRLAIDHEAQGMMPPTNNGWYVPYGVGDWEFDDGDDWNS